MVVNPSYLNHSQLYLINNYRYRELATYIMQLFCPHGILTNELDGYRGCSICSKERTAKIKMKIDALKREFDNNPEKRFEYIKKLGLKMNYQTTYVIELDQTIMQSQSEPAYPSANGKFPETRLHTLSSRCFYVGQTRYSAEERFHTANVNHMAKKTGKVTKHRIIKDSPPYYESIKRINELTESFGFDNPKNGNQNDKFEHYVAWALYKYGHRTWGPKNSDLGRNSQNGQWLGEDPYI